MEGPMPEFEEEELVLEAKPKKKAREKHNQAKDDLIAVMETVPGRRVIQRLLEDTGLYRVSFTGNATTYFNEGMRNVGLRILADLQDFCPQLFLLMQQEHMKKGADDER
jgi:hypothetical protein